jgi:hypothetical protein
MENKISYETILNNKSLNEFFVKEKKEEKE